MVPWPAKGFRGAHEEEEKKEEEKKEEDGREWDDERWRGEERRCRLGCAGAAVDGVGSGGSAAARRPPSLRFRMPTGFSAGADGSTSFQFWSSST